MSPRRATQAAAALASLLLWGCAAAPSTPASGEANGVAAAAAGREGFEGSASCRDCHAAQYASWEGSLHARTVHPPSDQERALLARALLCDRSEAPFVLGERHARRFLVPSEAEPGRHVLLPCRYDIGPAEWSSLHAGDWKSLTWERACGACHTTGFSSRGLGFHEMGVGCEACHGAARRHGAFADKGTMASFPQMSAREEVTVCASCHLQGGVSKSTGLSFASDYEPGMDLFSDYEFRWESLDAAAADANNPIDVHQKLLIRAQVRDGGNAGIGLRCTSCHAAHGFEHTRHALLARGEYCHVCHNPSDFSVKEYDQSCNVCEF
jgi:hypothetical protein